MKTTIKNPSAPATSKQTWYLFCLTKEDHREKRLTRQEASDLIEKYKEAKNKPKPKKDLTDHDNWSAIWDKACKAGSEAAEAKEPQMISIKGEPNYSFPICGFAWVNIKPGNSRFAKWLVACDLASKDSYEGGVTFRVHQYDQSYDKKYAYAQGVASVLREAGIRASYNGRLD